MKRLKQHPLTHVIWDWNGTLVDDACFCASIVSEILQEWNLPGIQKEDYRRRFRFPVREFYDELGFSGGEDEYLEVCESFITKYRTGWMNCCLQDGAAEVLGELQMRGVSQVALSASQQDHLEENLEYFGIADYFDAILGQDNIRAEGKIERGRQWFEERKISADSTLLVGDTNHDCEVAAGLSVPCLLYSNGHQDWSQLVKLPSKKITCLLEVLNVFA